MTYKCHGCQVRHSEDNMVAYCAVCVHEKDKARVKTEKALEYMTLKAKGACGKCKFDSDSLRAEIASTKDDLRVMTNLYHSNRRCQCSDEDCCAYEREKEALRAELATLRKSLRLKTEECEVAVRELKRVQEQSLAWFQDSANKDAQLKELEAALASSQQHHAYDVQRKDEILRDYLDGFAQDCGCSVGECVACENCGAVREISAVIAPSTPVEAEAWAREQKDGKEK